MATSKEISLKLVIDTKEKRVLFGEANNDCLEFLTHILSLPVSKVVSLLGEQDTVADLYETLANPPPKVLNTCGNGTARLLAHNTNPNAVCQTCQRPNSGPQTLTAHQQQLQQQKLLQLQLQKQQNPKQLQQLQQQQQQQKQVVVSTPRGGVKALVLDDLVVKPLSSVTSYVSLLNEFNVKDLGSLQEKVVNLGMDEAVKLLKAYLETKNVLTNVFLQKDLLGSPTTDSLGEEPAAAVGKSTTGTNEDWCLICSKETI